MRAKWVAGISTVALLSLVGLGGTVFFAVRVVKNMLPEGRSWIACRSIDDNVSLLGCTEVIQGGKSPAKNLLYAYNRRSVVYINRKQYDLAIADSNQAIRIDPNRSVSYYDRATAYLRKGDYENGLQDFNRTIQLDPANEPAWFSRAMVYRHKEDFPRAIADFNQTLRLDPNVVQAYIYRGSAFAQTGDLSRALSDCNQALKLRPGDSFAIDCRAFTYLKMGKFDLALSDYNNAVLLQPTFAGWLYGRGIVKRNLRDKKGAEEDIAKALKMDPKVAIRYKRLGVG